MKSFHCNSCGMMVFFENDRCVKCGHSLGFLPDRLELSALEIAPDGGLCALSPSASGKHYRNCANGLKQEICNWLVPVVDANPFCAACRLNQIIPDLTKTYNVARWKKLELAKRRFLYTCLKLGLPTQSPSGSNQPTLSFQFLEEQENAPVKTGHQAGVITINIAEADEDEREHRRLNLHEPYRTLVGHLRHESGHFYWERLIAQSSNWSRFRELFGDETLSYDAALQRYYQHGPPADWPTRTVTAYASSHPWEDWAETWAHYLHIMDTLETAASFGISVNPDNAPNNSSHNAPPVRFNEWMDFTHMIADWVPLTCALNSINRGMGLSDLYPFVIPLAVVEKLRFIHEVIHAPDHWPCATSANVSSHHQQLAVG